MKWYKNKEEQDLKAVEFQIIAAEDKLEFIEDGEAYYKRLKRHDLLPGTEVTFKNIMRKTHDTFVTHIFDATHVTHDTDSATTHYLIGIVVEFDAFSLPRFELTKSEFFDGFFFFDAMKKVNNKLLPDWLKNRYSLFHYRKSSPDEVVQLFQDKVQLEKVLSRRYFHLLAANRKMLVIYLKGENRSNRNFYKNMERVGISLAHLFNPNDSKTKSDSMSDEIQLLKDNQVT